ncbi:MAG TPA: EAL domain-containing protein [Methyloceanibacter sp.]|nr:EAL domain-containing protein [Methyloceanibacter sp.]
MTKDLLVIAAVTLPLYVSAVWYEALDLFFELTRTHQNHAFDWLLLLVIFAGVAAKIFSIRRVIDLRREVAARRKTEADAYQLARHDVLTGLPNRRWFIEDFDRWATKLPEGEACALFVVDLDNFKPINDVYGHRLGDEVLKVVAKRLTRIAEGGSVARLGGDEFGIILRYRLGSDSLERMARRIVHEIPKPISLAALSLQVGVSVGISTGLPQETASNVAMAARDGGRVETALRQADMAMYWAKKEGRGRYCFFDRSMDEKLQERVQLEAEIRGAIAAGQIVPYYQSIVELDTSSTVAVEVLARWEHPVRGTILPDVFIPIAEDTGTIGELTEYLLERAMHDAKDWPARVRLSFNLSPRQISDQHLAAKILDLLGKIPFPPHRLEIEITEGALLSRLEEAKAVLKALRHVGVRVALDDFGTGYSGLRHLRELDIDTLKIDRSFVGQMLTKPEEARIVKAMLSLGRALGLTTTAEGIENKEVLEHLMKLGCDAGQGYLFGKPQTAAVVAETLAKEAGRTPKPHQEGARPRRIA